MNVISWTEPLTVRTSYLHKLFAFELCLCNNNAHILRIILKIHSNVLSHLIYDKMLYNSCMLSLWNYFKWLIWQKQIKIDDLKYTDDRLHAFWSLTLQLFAFYVLTGRIRKTHTYITKNKSMFILKRYRIYKIKLEFWMELLSSLNVKL